MSILPCWLFKKVLTVLPLTYPNSLNSVRVSLGLPIQQAIQYSISGPFKNIQLRISRVARFLIKRFSNLHSLSLCCALSKSTTTRNILYKDEYFSIWLLNLPYPPPFIDKIFTLDNPFKILYR